MGCFRSPSLSLDASANYESFIELIVFGKEIMAVVIHLYSLLTNTWSYGIRMNAPRCLFGFDSLGEIFILVASCDSRGNILNSAELFNLKAKR
ncbi:hypothetical protein H5410_005629 [Solanum commersonii]|uniref:Uncharacterized protein n=1 Tax=Solanum commersonii TaxID=4109 RepID=A0A9J6A7Z4_SOLCO|nr:hypothetical protein H5410_005629 [Solanum commersonii]